MALIKKWQLQAKQRQEQVQARKQKIQATLADLQKQRGINSLEVRGELSLFKENLEKEEERRQQQEKLRTAMRGEFCENLHRHTQDFLRNTTLTRQANAQQLTAELDDFVAFLQERTQEFLAETSAGRMAMTEHLHQDLAEFHRALSATVAQLRAQMQIDIKILKAETQQFLSIAHLERLQNKAILTEKLTVFMEFLRLEVQTYLQELKLMRTEKAQNLEEFLQKSRNDRMSEVKALFNRLAVYRQQLQEYRCSLQAEVWGAGVAAELKPAPALPPTTAVKTETVKQKPVEERKPKITIAFETEVYEYIWETQGARLVEIETALAINRIQAVDALRSLVKKNLIVQRERLYMPVNF